MEWVSGNLFIRPSGILEAGQRCGGHTHNFDHTTIVFTGSVHVVKWAQRVRSNGDPMLDDAGEEVWLVVTERDFAAPAHFLIEANARHDIIALEDGTQYWCCYAHRSPQGDVTQEVTGWEPAYG